VASSHRLSPADRPSEEADDDRDHAMRAHRATGGPQHSAITLSQHAGTKMTIGLALNALSGIAILLAVAAATVATTGTSAEAANPVVRDHRTTPAWRFREKKTNNPAVIRDNRTPSTWQPKTKKPRWPHYPHKH
jgi:hypothetical protein